MKLTYDEVWSYPGFGGCESIAHVRVFEAPGKLPVVIAGELDDNPGTSITNRAEYLARLAQETYFPDGREFVFVEFYPRRGYEAQRDSGYSVTTFDLDKAGKDSAGEPSWRYASKEHVESLVGCSLPTWPEPGSYTTATAKGRTPA